MKLCQIYKFASHYRKSIYQLLDQEIGSVWYLGKPEEGIKELDTSILKGKVFSAPYHNWHGIKWQSKTFGALFKDFDTYLFIGDPSSINVWIFCALSRTLFPQKRIFFWTHGWYGKETLFKKIVKKAFFKLANGGIFLYGNYAKGLMIKEGFDPGRLFVIHNSLDYEKQIEIRKSLSSSTIYYDHFHNYNPVLIFVGRLTPQKKLHMVIEALKRCKDAGHNYNLVFVGDGNQRKALEKMTNDLHLSGNVWFYGECYEEDKLGEFIFNADLCVSPGNVGLTAMHSLMFGTPVCTHNNFPYQMPEFEAVKEGETGTFFMDGNVESLAEKVIEWLERHKDIENDVRIACFNEIDNYWNPNFQIKVFKQHLLH